MNERVAPRVVGAAAGAFCTAALLAGCAASAPAKPDAVAAGKDTCVFFSSVYDWQGLDDTTLVLWAPGRRDAYLVKTSFPIPSLSHEFRLAFVDGNRDGRLCSYGGDAIVASRVAPQRSSINSIRAVDDAGLAALEEQYQVKLIRDRSKREQNGAK